MAKQTKKEKLSVLLKKKRIAAGLRQHQLAQMLGYTSPQFISNWERGLARPPAFHLKTLGKILRIPSDELLQMLLSDVREKLIAEFRSGKRPRRGGSGY